MKGYLFTAILVLMMITSMGIFGYLSSAFQDNVLPYQVQNEKITLLENEKAEAEKLKTERMTRQEEINKQIANLPSDFVRGRQKLLNANKDELDQITKDITQYTTDIRQHTTEISQLKGQVVQETAHVGPIIFIAEAFGLGINSATKWLIFMIIAAFDPLAVILTVGLNMALKEYKETKMTTNFTKEYTLPEPTSYPPMPNVPPPKVDIVTQPIAPTNPPIIRNANSWYSEDGGMSFKNPAPNAAAPMVGSGHYSTGFITSGVGIANTLQPLVASAVAPPQPKVDNAVLNYFNRDDLTPQEEVMRDSIKKTIQNYTEVAEQMRQRNKQ